MTATDLHRQLLAAVGDGFADRAADLYAPDAQVEIPFAAEPGARVVSGAEQVRTRFRETRAAGISARIDHVRLYPSANPAVSVAEYDYIWTAPDRAPFATRNVQVIEVRDDCIVATRDYHDHAAIGRGLRDSAGVVAAWMHAAFNRREYDAVWEIFAPDFVSHPLGGAGRDVVRERWRAMVESDPSLRVTTHSVVADAEVAAVRSTAQGAQTPARELFEFVRVDNGQIRELWGAVADGD